MHGEGHLGHLLRTNHVLRTQVEGMTYTRAQPGRCGHLCHWIKGIHLNQPLTGEHCEKVRMDPPKLAKTFEERQWQVFLYAFAVDQHFPFVCQGIGELVNRVSPDYLTFEFITESKQQERYLQEQKRALLTVDHYVYQGGRNRA